jgi:hypothetical protein
MEDVENYWHEAESERMEAQESNTMSNKIKLHPM